MRKIKLSNNTVILLVSLLFDLNLKAQWLDIGSSSLFAEYSNSAYICADKFNNIYVTSLITSNSKDCYVYKWNGSIWNKIGGLNGQLTGSNFVRPIAADNFGNVYAAGSFTNSTGKHFIAKWDGQIWSELGGLNSFMSNKFEVGIITSDNNNNIYVSGRIFNVAGYDSTIFISKWNGINWIKLPVVTNSGSLNLIYTMCVDAIGNLYTAGTYTNSLGNYAINKWNGTSWNELSGTNSLNANGPVLTIYCDQFNNIYAGGGFTNTTGNFYVSKWDGNAWVELIGLKIGKPNQYNGIYTISGAGNGNIFAGGIGFLNNKNEDFVGMWDGAEWKELAGLNGTDANISSLCVDVLGNLYAAGSIRNMGTSNFSLMLKKYLSPLTVEIKEKNIEPDLLLYPNPVSNKLNFTFEKDNNQKFNISFANALGQSIYEQANANLNEAIDVSFLNAGIYFVKIQNQNSQKTFKVIKE